MVDIGDGVFIAEPDDVPVPGVVIGPGDGEGQLSVEAAAIPLLAPELGDGHGEAEVPEVVDPDVV